MTILVILSLFSSHVILVDSLTKKTFFSCAAVVYKKHQNEKCTENALFKLTVGLESDARTFDSCWIATRVWQLKHKQMFMLKILCFLLHNLSQLLKTNSLISFKVYIQTCTWNFGNIMKSLKLLTWSINWPLCGNVICCDVHIVHVSMIPFINRGFFFWRVAILLIPFTNLLCFFWLYY